MNSNGNKYNSNTSNDGAILPLISKLLLLVIVSGLFTLLLIGIIVIRVISDKLSHWPQTIQSVGNVIWKYLINV